MRESSWPTPYNLPPPYSQPPPHYAAPASNGNGTATTPLGERVMRLEERQRQTVEQVQGHGHSLHELWRHLRHLEETGRQVITELPATIDARVRPVEAELAIIKQTLAQRWWEPMRPHLWKIYMALGFMAASRLHKYFTGQTLDITTLLTLLRG